MPAALEAYQERCAHLQALRELLDQISATLAQRTGSIEAAGTLLGELGDRLVKHFAMEESGGYLSEAILHAPRLVSRANDLLNQHPKMQAAADRLRELAAQPRQAARWWEETELRFKEFAEELSTHEKNEDRLLQEAYSSDVEASD